MDRLSIIKLFSQIMLVLIIFLFCIVLFFTNQINIIVNGQIGLGLQSNLAWEEPLWMFNTAICLCIFVSVILCTAAIGTLSLGAGKNNKESLAFLRDSQNRWYWFTLLIACLAVIFTLLVPDIYPIGYIRIFFSVFFVLFFPGYTLLKLVFPNDLLNKDAEPLVNLVERVALSFGLSLIFASLVGLFWDYATGINLFTITISLFVLVFIFATLALTRKYHYLKKNL